MTSAKTFLTVNMFLLLSPTLLLAQSQADSKCIQSGSKCIIIDRVLRDNTGNVIIEALAKEITAKGPASRGEKVTFFGTPNNLVKLEVKEGGFKDDRVKHRDGSSGGKVSEKDLAAKDAAEKAFQISCGDGKDVEFKSLSKEQTQSFELKLREDILKKQAILAADEQKPNTEYLFKKPNGELVYIDKSAYDGSADSIKIYSGKSGQMTKKELQSVKEVNGAIVCDLGANETVKIPKDFTNEDQLRYIKPSWNDVMMDKLNPTGTALSSLGIKDVPLKKESSKTPCDKFYPAKIVAASGGLKAKPESQAFDATDDSSEGATK